MNIKILNINVEKLLSNKTDIIKVLKNISWLVIDKVIKLAIGLFVGVWVARYLGPQNFGSLNYAIAFIGIFGSISTLGLNNIVIKDLVENPNNSNNILGSAFVLQLIGSIVTIFMVNLVTIYFDAENQKVQLIVAIISCTLFFQTTSVIKYYFESKISSKYIVLIENIAFITMALTRVILIEKQASVYAFAWVIAAEAFIISIGMMVIYFYKDNQYKKWRFKINECKNLLNNSWPMLLSGMAIMLYMRIDQIMLGKMLGDSEVGIFSAALRLSEVWYMIPMIILPSLYPILIDNKKNNEVKYGSLVQLTLDFMVGIALLIAVVITVFSGDLIVLIYGDNYKSAAPVLAVHIWASIFVFIGVAGSYWYLTENLQKLSFYRTILGAIINIVLNYILIPTYGVLGSAIATVIAQAFSSYFGDLLSKKTIPIFYIKTKAIFFPIRVVKKLLI
jgi:PST family polysaccharide transporter